MLDRIYFEDEAEENVFEDCNVVEDFELHINIEIINSGLTLSDISSKLFSKILHRNVYDIWCGTIHFFYINGIVMGCEYITDDSDELDCFEQIIMDIAAAIKEYLDL